MAHIYHVILESIANGFLDPVEDAELVTAMIQQAGLVEDDTRERASQAVNIRRREWTLDSFPLSRFPQTFRFESPEDVRELMTLLGFPERWVLPVSRGAPRGLFFLSEGRELRGK